MPVVPLAALYGVAWIAEHIIEVAVVSGACGVLAVAAVVALMRWTDRRDARHAAELSLWSVREVPAAIRPSLISPAAVTSAERPALGFRDLHIHLDGQPTAEQAHVIRQALGRN